MPAPVFPRLSRVPLLTSYRCAMFSLFGVLLFLFFASVAACADDVTWTLGGDGFWDVASNWSSDPNLPAAFDDVKNLTNFTIEHRAGDDTINSFLSDGAFILSGGSLTVNTMLQVNNTFTMNGGMLANATVKAGSGGQSITVSGDGSIFSNVTLNADATINYSANLTIQNGFHNASGINFNLISAAYVYVHGDQTLDNLNINFVDTSSYGTIYAYDTLTLETGFKASGKYGVFQGNNIVNDGILSANVSGGTWQINSSTFTNNGTVQAKNGEIVYLDNTQYLGSMGKYDTQGTGIVQLQDKLDNTGKTFDVATQVTGTQNFIVNGTILNGTVNGSDILKFNGGTLDGVALGSGLNLNQAGAYNQVTIQNNFVYPRGTTFTLGNGAYLNVHGDRTFDNLNINFVADNGFGYLYAYDNLTLGSSFKASGKYGYFQGNTIVNNGNLSANVLGGVWYIEPIIFINNGTVEAKNGDNIAVNTSSIPTDSGNIHVDTSSVISFATNLNQTGGTTTTDGDLYLNPGAGGSSLLNLSAGALLGKGTVHGNLTNGGRVQPGSGDASAPAKLSLTGNYTQTTVGILDIRLGSATDFGQLAIGGNAILNGTLDVSLSNGYHPAVGTEFDILTASNVSGTFATTGSLNTGFAYDVTYAPTFVRIKVTNNAVPGPDSLIVLGMGLMGVAARVRRRRK